MRGVKKGTIIRTIDIKNMYNTSYLEANYKAQFYKTPGKDDDSEWYFNVIQNLPYKKYSHDKVLYLALKWWLEGNRKKTNDRLD